MSGKLFFLNLFTEDSEKKDGTLSDSELVNKAISEYLESEGITLEQVEKRTVSDYDNAWKEAIETYFEEFMLFFFPHIHKDIDFSKDFTFLDKEFQKIVKDSDDKKRYADKLVRVCLRNGKEKLILIHIEVQAGKKQVLKQGCINTTTEYLTDIMKRLFLL